MISVSQLINDKNNPAANQFVIVGEQGVYFQSYDSVIAQKNNNDGKIYLSPSWDYSKTTLKHLYIFLRDYTRFSVNSKKDVEYNIKNGNFVKVSGIELI
jgi:hypothetical protein